MLGKWGGAIGVGRMLRQKVQNEPKTGAKVNGFEPFEVENGSLSRALRHMLRDLIAGCRFDSAHFGQRFRPKVPHKLAQNCAAHRRERAAQPLRQRPNARCIQV
jgi:hypothetical protein